VYFSLFFNYIYILSDKHQNNTRRNSSIPHIYIYIYIYIERERERERERKVQF